MEILDGVDDKGLCKSNLTNITAFSKRDLHNKLKAMKITLANQSGSLKEGTTVDELPSQKTWTEGSVPQGNSKLQQTAPGDEGSRLHDDDSSLSLTSSEEKESGPAAVHTG